LTYLSLNIEEEYDFKLLAISSNQKGYTLCWSLNRDLHSDLSLQEPIIITQKKVQFDYKLFSSSEGFRYVVLANKSKGKRLLPELPTVDYLLKYYEDECPFSNEELTSKLRKLSVIQAVYSLNPETLKHKQHLIFD